MNYSKTPVELILNRAQHMNLNLDAYLFDFFICMILLLILNFHINLALDIGVNLVTEK